MIKIKLVCLVVILGCNALNAEVWPQEKRINMKFEQTNLIDFFKHLQKETHLKFVYNHEDIQNFTVNGSASGKTIAEILDMALSKN